MFYFTITIFGSFLVWFTNCVLSYYNMMVDYILYAYKKKKNYIPDLTNILELNFLKKYVFIKIPYLL